MLRKSNQNAVLTAFIYSKFNSHVNSHIIPTTKQTNIMTGFSYVKKLKKMEAMINRWSIYPSLENLLLLTLHKVILIVVAGYFYNFKAY